VQQDNEALLDKEFQAAGLSAQRGRQRIQFPVTNDNKKS